MLSCKPTNSHNNSGGFLFCLVGYLVSQLYRTFTCTVNISQHSLGIFQLAQVLKYMKIKVPSGHGKSGITTADPDFARSFGPSDPHCTRKECTGDLGRPLSLDIPLLVVYFLDIFSDPQQPGPRTIFISSTIDFNTDERAAQFTTKPSQRGALYPYVQLRTSISAWK